MIGQIAPYSYSDQSPDQVAPYSYSDQSPDRIPITWKGDQGLPVWHPFALRPWFHGRYVHTVCHCLHRNWLQRGRGYVWTDFMREVPAVVSFTNILKMPWLQQSCCGALIERASTSRFRASRMGKAYSAHHWLTLVFTIFMPKLLFITPNHTYTPVVGYLLPPL